MQDNASVGLPILAAPKVGWLWLWRPLVHRTRPIVSPKYRLGGGDEDKWLEHSSDTEWMNEYDLSEAAAAGAITRTTTNNNKTVVTYRLSPGKWRPLIRLIVTDSYSLYHEPFYP